MPITFKSGQVPNIITLDSVGLQLLKLSGHSGTVPGSFAPEDLAAALARLQSAVSRSPDASLDNNDKVNTRDGDDNEPKITLAQRALPLIAMLETALAEGDYVIWERK